MTCCRGYGLRRNARKCGHPASHGLRAKRKDLTRRQPLPTHSKHNLPEDWRRLFDIFLFLKMFRRPKGNRLGVSACRREQRHNISKLTEICRIILFAGGVVSALDYLG